MTTREREKEREREREGGREKKSKESEIERFFFRMKVVVHCMLHARYKLPRRKLTLLIQNSIKFCANLHATKSDYRLRTD